MPKLFDVDIAGIVAKNLGSGLLPAFLTQNDDTDRTAGSLTAGKNTSTTDYACRGFTEDYTDRELTGTLIQTSDRKIILLGGTLPVNIVPVTGDKVTIEGVVYTVVNVKRDPAAATYTIQGRG